MDGYARWTDGDGRMGTPDGLTGTKRQGQMDGRRRMDREMRQTQMNRWGRSDGRTDRDGQTGINE